MRGIERTGNKAQHNYLYSKEPVVMNQREHLQYTY